MKRPDGQELITKAARGTLSDAEKLEWEELLGREATVRDRFAEEVALEKLLGEMPDVPISSNFTSLVLQAATKEAPVARGWFADFGWPRFRSIFARLATGIAVVSAIAVGVNYQQRKSEQENMAARVKTFTEVATALATESTPPEELFQNFEAIQRLSLPAEGDLDMELLFALQK